MLLDMPLQQLPDQTLSSPAAVPYDIWPSPQKLENIPDFFDLQALPESDTMSDDINRLRAEIARLREIQQSMLMAQNAFRQQVMADINDINSRLENLYGRRNLTLDTHHEYPESASSDSSRFEGFGPSHAPAGSHSSMSFSDLPNTASPISREHPFADIFVESYDNRKMPGINLLVVPPFHMDRNILTIQGLVQEWFLPNPDKYGQCVSLMERQFKTRWRTKAGDKKFFLSRKRIIDFILQEVKRNGGGDGQNITNGAVAERVIDDLERFRVNPQTGAKLSLEKLSKIIKESRGSLPGVGDGR